MIIFHNFGDAGLSACSPRLKQMPVPAVPLGIAIASIASSALGTGANALMQKRANEQNIANQNSLYQKQKEYQNFLNANGMLIQKQAMQRAGFNPNAQFGTSANLQSPTPSKSDVVAPQLDTAGINSMLQQYMQLEQQQPVIDAEVRKKDAEAKEILSRIPLNDANTQNIIQNTANLLQQHGILQFQNETQKQQFDASLANLFADTSVKQSQALNIDWDNKLKDLEYQLENASLETRKQIYAQTLADLEASVNLKDAERQLALQRVNESVATTAFSYAQINRLNKLLDAELANLKADENVKKQQKQFIIAQASFVKTKEDWYEFEKMLQSLNVSKDAIITIGKHTPFYKNSPKQKFKKGKGGVR